jgi:membrane-associated phospholipid phosphatase
MSTTTTLLCLLLLLLTPTALSAQTLPMTPVEPWSDALSYGTAVVNPSIAAWKAWHSNSRGCKLFQLAIAELTGNGTSLTIKHFTNSPRPCFLCQPDGMPSGHTMNAAIGQIESGFAIGYTFSWGTGILRTTAHRHTPTQVVAGWLIGAGADALGHLKHCG